MLTKLFVFLCRFRPIKRILWRRWYDFLALKYPAGDWTFMNYGYAGPGRLDLQAPDEPNRHFIQLYDFVARQASLKELHVLEVGCGRGGGASYIKRYLGPATVTGLDLSSNAVELCSRLHRVAGLSFKQGAAEALPFADESFDAVLNVESSHCYGSMYDFLCEVRRVLRPGGFFLYADFRDSHTIQDWLAQLADSRMTMLRETDITANVLAALDADNERKAAMIEKLVPKPLISAFKDFAGMQGSVLYEGFRTGAFSYRAFQMKKTP